MTSGNALAFNSRVTVFANRFCANSISIVGQGTFPETNNKVFSDNWLGIFAKTVRMG